MSARSHDLALLLEATTPTEAALARGLLEPEGIPCLVEGRGLGDVANNELHKIAGQRASDVHVPRAELDRARALLAAAWEAVPLPSRDRTPRGLAPDDRALPGAGRLDPTSNGTNET